MAVPLTSLAARCEVCAQKKKTYGRVGDECGERANAGALYRVGIKRRKPVNARARVVECKGLPDSAVRLRDECGETARERNASSQVDKNVVVTKQMLWRCETAVESTGKGRTVPKYAHGPTTTMRVTVPDEIISAATRDNVRAGIPKP